MTVEISLGTPVSFQEFLIRETQGRHYKAWVPHLLPDAIEGIIVGVRTLANGRREGGWDEPYYFVPSIHLTAYLVAYEMRRRPVFVWPDRLLRVGPA